MAFTVNQKIGKLTLLERIKGCSTPPRVQAQWVCRCDCGTVKKIRENNIVMGMSRSCGCGHKAQKSREIGDALAAPWRTY